MSVFALTCAIISACLVLVCILYPNRSVGTRQREDLSGPPGLPLLGNLVEILQHRNSVLLYISGLEKRYGELFSFTMPGWGRSIVINRPEWLEHVRKCQVLCHAVKIVHANKLL